jgi:hypothetical protein
MLEIKIKVVTNLEMMFAFSGISRVSKFRGAADNHACVWPWTTQTPAPGRVQRVTKTEQTFGDRWGHANPASFGRSVGSSAVTGPS